MEREYAFVLAVVILGLAGGYCYGKARSADAKLPTTFKDKPLMNTFREYERVLVPMIVCLWYFCSVVSNNAGKLVLPIFPYPLTLSLVQFLLAAGSVPLARSYQGLPVAPLLALPLKCWQRGLVLGSAGVVSNVMHRVALMYIPVSFAHTVKAVQPLFTVLLSFTLLRQTFTYRTMLALLVVVGGVALSAFKEPQFSFIGFFAAGSSALSMSIGSVSQKKFLQRVDSSAAATASPGSGADSGKGARGESAGSSPTSSSLFSAPVQRLEKGEVFFLTAFYSALLVSPVWLWRDASSLASFTFSGPVVSLVLANTATNVLQHFISLSILAIITPVSHSVMNSLKRVVVITLSVLYFRNTVSALNGLGICMALGGVFLYERSVRTPVGGASREEGAGSAGDMASQQYLLPRLGSDLQLADLGSLRGEGENGASSSVTNERYGPNGWLHENESPTRGTMA